MKQTKYSSPVHEWMEKIMENRGSNAEEVLRYCDKLQEHGEKVKDNNLLGFAQYYRGETYYLLNYADGMFRNLISAVDNLKKAGVHELEASAYNLLGIVSVNQGNAHFALDYYLTGLQLCEWYELRAEEGLILHNIGSLYFKYQEYKKAIDYFQRSRHLLKKKERQFYTDISIASCYLEEGYVKKVRKYVSRTKERFVQSMDEMTQLYFWCFQARLCQLQQETEKRDYYIARITDAVNEYMPIMEIFEDLYIYCKMLLETEHYQELKKMLQVMGQVVEQTDILHLRMRILGLEIELYRKCGQKQAYMNAAVEYYELGKIAEQENRYVINSALDVRFSLEEERKHSDCIERENRVLQQKSEMDPLTGLANRFLLNESAEKAFQNAYVEKYILGIEILDIDYFKEYNDNYGHQRGDECLIKIAEAMQKIAVQGDIFCARYGGDEFILIYEKYSQREIYSLAEQLKQEIAKMKIEHKFSKAADEITISQGICFGIPKAGQKVWDYLSQADKMLYQVKRNNKNGIMLGENEDQHTGTQKEKTHSIKI